MLVKNSWLLRVKILVKIIAIIFIYLLYFITTRVHYYLITRELKQSRRRRQQKPHKFAYLTIKNSIFARFARAFFIF